MALMCVGVFALGGCGARAFLHLDRRVLWDDLRVVLGGGGNSTVLLHGSDALVIDPKMLGYTQRLRDEVERDLGRRVRRLILTHAHYDHAGGATDFAWAGAVLVHPNTRARLLANDQGPCDREAPPAPRTRDAFRRSEPVIFDPPHGALLPVCALPFVEVTSEVRLWLGGEEVQVMNLGSGHTDGDLVAYFPDRKLLVAGDLVMNGFRPHIDESSGGSLLHLADTLDRLLGLPFEKVVPGHGDLGGRDVVERQRRYLRALEEDVKRAIAAGAPSEDAVVGEVKLREEFEDLPPIPGDPFEKDVRRMYRELHERGD
ncbi:MAG: MBL fold metallo-hydrolase [Myxococcaceae bacterium]|nr:MBL fold metallo-hydrolase [Myxococcaceae bacterium]